MTESHSPQEAIPQLNPDEFIITRKRKLYKFAKYHNSPICFEVEEWDNDYVFTELEVGAGTGLFSVGLATQHENQRFVAVDVKADRLQTGARQSEEAGLPNIRFLRARADQLPDLIAPSSLNSVWVTFPDPQPKARTAKNRLLHPKFLSVYKYLLHADGALYFKTDAPDLFTWSLEQLVRADWTIVELVFDLHESDLSDKYKIKTTYETKYMNQGLKIMFVKALPPEM